MRTSCPRWKLRRTFTAAGPRGRTSVVVVPAVPVALDRWQERRFEVRDRAGRGLAVDELRPASFAGGAEAAFAALQTNRDDVAVVVAMLDGGVLGHVQRPHRWVASAGTPGCQSMAAWQRVVAPPRPRCHDDAVAPANRLARETSPYLLQHAHNPVDWFPWGEEAFARARAENKPILLSVGYSACHWCHVMERESFENPDIARLMNQLFVNVKVDREERPDVDDVYMKAVQVLTGRGGRPMTVFLTPEGKPFYGGTYFPPVDPHGLPRFPRLLQALARAPPERPARGAQSVERILSALENVEQPRPSEGPLDAALPRHAADGLLGLVDRRHGGLGGAPKSPHASAR